MAKPISFGKADEGREVLLVCLATEGIAVNVMSWGASVQDLRITSHDFPLVLGFRHFDSYLKHPNYFGATVGRCANRIAGGQFEIDGHTYKTAVNEKTRGNTLHGANALSHKNWDLIGHNEKSAQFKLIDPDGNNGFPGTCEILATFEVKDGGALRIIYEVTTDKPTPVNIAHHSYFNLNGGGDVLDHKIEIDAGHYLPVDQNLIPTGEITPVKDTPFDFTKSRKIRDAGGSGFLHDHNFCLNGKEGDFRKIAHIHSPKSGISMEMKTTEIGLQFYTSKGLDVETIGLNDSPYPPFSGMCLEAQKWPDGINHSKFPEMILRPRDEYRQETSYRFFN